jgi:hypothetical protein
MMCDLTSGRSFPHNLQVAIHLVLLAIHWPVHALASATTPATTANITSQPKAGCARDSASVSGSAGCAVGCGESVLV